MSIKIDQKTIEYITQDQDNTAAKDLNAFYGDDELAKDVIRNKYFAPWEESPFDMWVRLAWGAAQAEQNNKVDWAREFYNILFDFTFIPGGRIIAGLGRDDINVSFSNCYVVPIKEDSLDSIYDSLKNAALTYKSGGGVGLDLSKLRPDGAFVKGTGGISCGSVNFADLFSISTNTVAQRGRRGATMLMLDATHPDIDKFITIKNDAEKSIEALNKLLCKYPGESELFSIIQDQIESKRNVQYANISVKLSDKFMDAVIDDKDIDLVFEGTVYNTVKAKDIWNKITQNAYKCAEPGIVFWDRMCETNNIQKIKPLVATNPCSEIPLEAYGACLLGSNNLTKFVIRNNNKFIFDYDKLQNVTRLAVRFLDNVLQLGLNRHALHEQTKAAKESRRIGLGATGIGDLLIMLGLKYGDKESLDQLDNIFCNFRNFVYDSSADLAKEKGCFPLFKLLDREEYINNVFIKDMPNDLKNKIYENGTRGSNLLTMAPNGSLSIIAQTTSGIEPIFRTSYTRKVKNQSGSGYSSYTVYHPLIKNMFNCENIPDYVVDSTQISAEERIKVQAVVQKYIDNSISSTINLPSTSTVEDVRNIYILAYKNKLKGVTVYVDGSREGILLTNNDEINKEEKVEINKEEKVEINKNNRNALKRPKVLQSETHKRKVDLNGDTANNCYITVSFEPGTKKPYELLITETNTGKDTRSIMMLESVSRLISLCLRHNVPIEFIIQQLQKVQGSYIYSLPAICADILSCYIDYDSTEQTDTSLICKECYGIIKRENGCTICMDCGYSKCS